MKNYKNMYKYTSNQVIMEEPTCENSADTRNIANNKMDPFANTPPISTADCSIITNKISSFFVSHN